MELSGELLILYVAAWGVFYILLTKFIAERSVQAWIDRFDKDKNPKGADLIVHLLEPVLDEIRDEQIDSLKQFKESFFKSVAPQVREAKKMVREMNPMGAALDELTKDNPLLGLIMSHVKLPEINLPASNINETAQNTAGTADIARFIPGKIK